MSWSWRLGSGYTNREPSTKRMREQDIAKLIAACEDAVKRFVPDGETTYCNAGTSFVAGQMGYPGFIALLANQIVSKMRTSPEWAEVDAGTAQKLANDGRLSVAGIQDEPHGHVAAIYPGAAVFSGKWKKLAPMVANCGRKNGLMGANYAFSREPQYWAWVA